MNPTRLLGILLVLAIWSCAQNEPELYKEPEFTGNEVTYPLVSASAYNISGTAILKERIDGTTSIGIALVGLHGGEGLALPAHLHFGDVTVDKAEIASLLSSVDGGTGKSETLLTQFADEIPIRFADLKNFNGCIKVHLSSTDPGRDVILAAGNIGLAAEEAIATGRTNIGICSSE